MNKALRNILKGLAKPVSRKSNMNVLAFTFFLLLSSFFWFSIALNKMYIDTISYPIRFKNFPTNRIQSDDLPEKIELTVETDGKKLLRHWLFSKIDPIDIDIAECYLYQLSKKDSSRFYILTDIERKLISSQLPSLDIKDIYPDTLLFKFDFLRKKKVPVVPNIEINCKQQYMMVGSPEVIPDSVLISGPSSLIDTLRALPTKKLVYTDVDDAIDEEIDLAHIKGIKFVTKSIRLQADVDSYTEEKINVKINARNVPDSLNLKLFPGSIQISYFVPYKLYSGIKAEDFEINVDFNNIGLMNNEKLRITIDKTSENIKVTGWEPRYVEYIIEK